MFESKNYQKRVFKYGEAPFSSEIEYRTFLINELGDDPLICNIAKAESGSQELLNAKSVYKSIRGQSIEHRVKAYIRTQIENSKS